MNECLQVTGNGYISCHQDAFVQKLKLLPGIQTFQPVRSTAFLKRKKYGIMQHLRIYKAVYINHGDLRTRIRLQLFEHQIRAFPEKLNQLLLSILKTG
ncbi:hypothetical protein D3C87_1852690 [compost metagenome]